MIALSRADYRQLYQQDISNKVETYSFKNFGCVCAEVLHKVEEAARGHIRYICVVEEVTLVLAFGTRPEISRQHQYLQTFTTIYETSKFGTYGTWPDLMALDFDPDDLVDYKCFVN